MGLAIDSELRKDGPPVSRCTVRTLRVTPVGVNLDFQRARVLLHPPVEGFIGMEVLIPVGNLPSLCLL